MFSNSIPIYLTRKLCFVLFAFTFSGGTYAQVPEAVEGCQMAIDAFESDPEQALEDARWCVEQLEQLQQDKEALKFRDEIAGFTAGPLNQEKMMGMSTISRTYSKDGVEISAQKIGVSDSSNPLSALGAFAQMGAAGGRKVRIAGHTGSVMTQGNKVTLILSLKEGGSFTFESSTANAEQVTKFAKAFFS